MLVPLKREFEADEIVADIWAARAREAGVSVEEFYEVARGLSARGVIGRFSTFLDHLCTYFAIPPGLDGFDTRAPQETGMQLFMCPNKKANGPNRPHAQFWPADSNPIFPRTKDLMSWGVRNSGGSPSPIPTREARRIPTRRSFKGIEPLWNCFTLSLPYGDRGT